jgi:hypothetical protein
MGVLLLKMLFVEFRAIFLYFIFMHSHVFNLCEKLQNIKNGTLAGKSG